MKKTFWGKIVTFYVKFGNSESMSKKERSSEILAEKKTYFLG